MLEHHSSSIPTVSSVEIDLVPDQVIDLDLQAASTSNRPDEDWSLLRFTEDP